MTDAKHGRTRALLFGLLCLLTLLSSCRHEISPLPEEGFDYRAREGVLLGYPIARRGENTFCLSANAVPSVWEYDEDAGGYRQRAVLEKTVQLGAKTSVSVRYAEGTAGEPVFLSSSADASDGSAVRICEGQYGGNCVLLWGGHLMLCGEASYTALHENCAEVFLVRDDTILYTAQTDTGETLYRYADGISEAIFTAFGIPYAWFAQDITETSSGTEEAGEELLFFCADGVWYAQTTGGTPVRCVGEEALFSALPEDGGAPFRSAMVLGTVFHFAGNNDTLYLFHALTGEKLDVDMGGIIRFGEQKSDVYMPVLSPDRRFLFMNDFDYLYRLDLIAGTVSAAFNNAPTYENACILSSVTAVNDTRLLLSQAAAEHTEYLAVLTEGVFEDDLPKALHEDDKIDLDTPSDGEDEEE